MDEICHIREYASWYRKGVEEASTRKTEALKTKTSRKEKPQPIFIVCPECNKIGRMNQMHRTDAQGNNYYVVTHEVIPGHWGVTELAKRRRCQFHNKKGIEQFKQIMGCSSCHSTKTYVRKSGREIGRIEWFSGVNGEPLCKDCYRKVLSKRNGVH